MYDKPILRGRALGLRPRCEHAYSTVLQIDTVRFNNVNDCRVVRRIHIVRIM